MKLRFLLLSLLAEIASCLHHEFNAVSGMRYEYKSVMWGSNSVSTGRDGIIQVKGTTADTNGSSVAVLVYEISDTRFLGHTVKDGKVFVDFCNQTMVSAGNCHEADLNKFLIDPSLNTDIARPYVDPNKTPYAHVYADVDRSNFTHNALFEYYVKANGLYVVRLQVAGAAPVKISVNIEYPYGLLDPELYPLLPLHGSLAIAYLVLALVWLGFSVKYWREILPVQHYIAGVIFAVMIDNSFYFGLYDNWNKTGTMNMGLFVTSAFLSAVRIASSFFVLLIVCLGFGVVKPSLGAEMKKCVALGVLLGVSFFIFNMGLIISDISLLASLFVVLPVSLAVTTYFYWIMEGLQQTISHLQVRRQTYKLQMYQMVKNMLIFALCTIIFMMIVSGIIVAKSRDLFYLSRSLASYWFIKWGWMNFLYLICLMLIVFYWRPTENNARYGLEELPDLGEADIEMGNNLEIPFRDGLEVKNRTSHRGTNDETEESLVKQGKFELFSSGEETDEEKSPSRAKGDSTDEDEELVKRELDKLQ